MGKGDIRTKRGKIWRGTTGKTRPKKNKKKGIINSSLFIMIVINVQNPHILNELPRIRAVEVSK